MAISMNKRTAALVGHLSMDPSNNAGDNLITVNGEAITEGNAVAYVRAFRGVMGLEDDTDWAVWCARAGLTDEDVATDTMDYLMSFVAQRQAAAELGISVSPAELEEEVGNAIRTLGEDGFAKAVERLGVTESQYREGLRECMLRDALFEKVTEGVAPTSEAEVRDAVRQYKGGAGKKDARPVAEISREAAEQIDLDKRMRHFDGWLRSRLTRESVQFCQND